MAGCPRTTHALFNSKGLLNMGPQNLLLAALPVEIHDRLAMRWQRVDLNRGDVLHHPGQEIKTLHFPLDCLISITVTMSEARTAEAGIVGSREMVGLNAFMGGRETNQTEYVCQLPGAAVRVSAEPFLEAFNTDIRVRDVMLRFTQAYIAQLSQNVACNRLHSMEQRMARWLLECRDRLQKDDFSITHEYIAQMLGVRRAGITETAAILQQKDLIKYGRGNLSVVNVHGLEQASCECFAVILDEYARLLGPAIAQAGNSLNLPRCAQRLERTTSRPGT
jgi:CRP-like cAMP-binding protein